MSADPDIAARYLPARRASVEGRRSSVNSLASRASNASSGAGTLASSAVVDAAASERLRRRRGAFKRQGTIKKLLRTMKIDWMARFEQNRAVYTTEVVVVVLSVVAYCLETVPSLEGTVDRVIWSGLELVFTAFFTTELALRYLATRETDTPFWSDVYVWFDIIAIIPFYFMVLACFGNPFSASCDLGDNFFISVLQATRILRVFKISRHFRGTKVLWWAFKESAHALQVPATFLLLSTTMFASLLYWVEQGQFNEEAQADLVDGHESPAFTSIVNAAYFCVVTIVTVGYGDIVPKTVVGKLLSCVVMIFGVLFTAMPLAIVGNEFYNAVEKDAQANGSAKKKQDEPIVASRLLDFEAIASRYVLLGSAMNELDRLITRWTSGNGSGNDDVALVHSEMEDMQLKLRGWVKMHLSFIIPLKKVARPPGQAAGCFFATVPWADLEKMRGMKRRWSSKFLSLATSFRDLKDDPDAKPVIVKLGWWPRTRSKLYRLLELPKSSRGARVLSRVVMVLVLLSIMGFTVETMIEIRTKQWNVNPKLFLFLDAFVNTFFTIEFIARFIVSYDRVAFCKDVFNMFDFVAILPFYIDFVIAGGVPFLRLARMLRIFKVSKNFTGTRILLRAIKESVHPLLIPLYMLVVFTLVFATALYLMERGDKMEFADGQIVRVHKDGTASQIDSVFSASWVILVTMTSVGYGDITPTTMFGKGVCTLAMLFGILYMAMPIAIVGTNFYKAYEASRSRHVRERLNQVTVPVTHNHVDVINRACSHARRLSLMLANVDWHLRSASRSHRSHSGPQAVDAVARATPLDVAGCDSKESPAGGLAAATLGRHHDHGASMTSGSNATAVSAGPAATSAGGDTDDATCVAVASSGSGEVSSVGAGKGSEGSGGATDVAPANPLPACTPWWSSADAAAANVVPPPPGSPPPTRLGPGRLPPLEAAAAMRHALHAAPSVSFVIDPVPALARSLDAKGVAAAAGGHVAGGPGRASPAGSGEGVDGAHMLTFRGVQRAVRLYMSEYVALASVLNFVRNSLKDEISGAANDTGEDAALAIAALSTGGRRQWTQFRAALAQKRHLDML